MILVCLTACTTITGRDLPIVKVPTFSLNNKHSLLIYSSSKKMIMSKESLESYLANLQFFSKVQIINDDHPVDQSDKDKFDIF